MFLRCIYVVVCIKFSFLLLSSIPLYAYPWSIHSPVNVTSVCLKFGATMNKARITILVQGVCVCVHMFLFLRWMFRDRVARYRVGICLTFWETSKQFSKVIEAFYIHRPPAPGWCVGLLVTPHSHQLWVIVRLLILVILAAKLLLAKYQQKPIYFVFNWHFSND